MLRRGDCRVPNSVFRVNYLPSRIAYSQPMVFVIHLLPSRSTTVTTVCRNDPEALYLSAIDPLLRFGDRRLVVCSTCFRTRMSYGEETKKENFPIEIRCRERVPCRRHLLRPTLRACPSLQALLCLYLRVTEESAKTQYGPCGAGLDAADEEEEKIEKKILCQLASQWVSSSAAGSSFSLCNTP